jgi:hypothetical protein
MFYIDTKEGVVWTSTLAAVRLFWIDGGVTQAKKLLKSALFKKRKR